MHSLTAPSILSPNPVIHMPFDPSLYLLQPPIAMVGKKPLGFGVLEFIL